MLVQSFSTFVQLCSAQVPRYTSLEFAVEGKVKGWDRGHSMHLNSHNPMRPDKQMKKLVKMMKEMLKLVMLRSVPGSRENLRQS